MLRPELLPDWTRAEEARHDSVVAPIRRSPRILAAAAPRPVGAPLPYSVQVINYRSFPAARRQLERLRGDSAASRLVFVSPQEVAGDPVLQDPRRRAADSTAAPRGEGRAWSKSGAIDAEDAADAGSLIRPTPLTFQLGEFATEAEARARADSLLAARSSRLRRRDPVLRRQPDAGSSTAAPSPTAPAPRGCASILPARGSPRASCCVPGCRRSARGDADDEVEVPPPPRVQVVRGPHHPRLPRGRDRDRRLQRLREIQHRGRDPLGARRAARERAARLEDGGGHLPGHRPPPAPPLRRGVAPLRERPRPRRHPADRDRGHAARSSARGGASTPSTAPPAASATSTASCATPGWAPTPTPSSRRG